MSDKILKEVEILFSVSRKANASAEVHERCAQAFQKLREYIENKKPKKIGGYNGK